MSKNRELIIAPKVPRGQLGKFLSEIEKEGIKIVNLDPVDLKGIKSKMSTVHTSTNANYVIVDKVTKIKGKKIGMKFKVLSNADIERILQFAKAGLDFVIIEVKDWKIIPLENIIAKLHKIHTEIFAVANTPEEVRKMFSILEIGVDGVIFSTNSINKVTGGKKRFRVTVQHPYPTYYYPNIMHEQIIILRKMPFHNFKDKKSKLVLNDLMKKEVANSVWHIAPMPPSYRKFHPAAFPEEIPYRLIQLYSNVGDLVLDPFVGSGQTTKMARFLHRKYFGIDKSAKYVKIAQKRTLEPPSLRKMQLVPNWKKPEPL